MDESNPTCNKRFAKLGIPQTEETRRAYRELIVNTPGLGECISGAILYDETIRQQKKDGTPFVKAITDAGIIPGIKVDTGAKAMAGHPGEKIAEGLDGLRDRLTEYAQTGTPLRALIWLAAIQRTDGRFPQNSWINGAAYWSGVQLDEVAPPILLAWRLHSEGVTLGRFDPCVMISRVAGYLIRQGPVTAQERWEENAGYSPSTLATVIAGLVCAAEFAKQQGEAGAADFILVYADWLAPHLEEWTVTTAGELLEGLRRHYIRINPTDPAAPDPHADPNTTVLAIANGGGVQPARNVVGGDFLHLVRLGIRAADDPLVRDSIVVMDRLLKCDLPQGPCWRRYNHDGYGQKDDGRAFDGTGVGRAWPILTGERGHYELAAGRDPMPFIAATEKFASEGGMISEQLWNGEDLGGMRRGLPTGAAMRPCRYAGRMRNMSPWCAALMTASVLIESNRPSSVMSATRRRAGMRFGASATRCAEYLLVKSYASSLRQTRPSAEQPIIGRVPTGWTPLITALSMCGPPICSRRAARTG
jgi:hypothetical protein